MSETATATPLASGRLEEQRDGMVVLSVPGTDYRLHLVADRPVETAEGTRVRGQIHCVARRVDVLSPGGGFIEPVAGRPRRIQGRVIAADPAAGTIVVKAGIPVVAKLGDPRQAATQFAPGQLVGFDVERGARFVPVT